MEEWGTVFTSYVLMHRHYTFFMRESRHWLLLILVSALCACGPKASSIHGNTEGYDLEHPLVVQLPTSLNEISGLWYYAKDTSLFAIEDEDGFLYKIFPKHPDRILRWKFHGHGDFEDLTMVDGTFYILRSDGSLFATTIASGENVQSVKYETPEKGNEFESVYYDDSLKLIILVCKDCLADKRKSLSTWAFNPATKQFVQSSLQVDAHGIAAILGLEKIKFKPSAAVINPFTNQLMLLASTGDKLLVTAKRDGSIIQAYPLGAKLYKQPEGIAIGADRTLYISNESAGIGSPTLLIMPYHAPGK